MTLRRLFLPSALAALVSACSPSSGHQAQATAECAVQVSGQAASEVFKVSCSSTTLEQLAAALQKTGRVKFKYPPELAATPLSATANGLPLGSVLASALQPFSYVLVREPARANQPAAPAQVAISGLRGISAGAKAGSAPIASSAASANDDAAILRPITKPSTMSAASANAPADPDSPILHPHPQPWTTPASATPSAAVTAAAAVILHPSPQPWTVSAPKTGATTP